MLNSVRSTKLTYTVNITANIVSTIIFLVGASWMMEGCDRADSMFAALAFAAIIDAVLLVSVNCVLIVRAGGFGKANIIAALIGISILGTLFLVAVAYINSIPAGCPV